MAIRIFGSPEEAFGKTITQVYGNTLKEIKIAGFLRNNLRIQAFTRAKLL
jgi:hypothetical protein